MFDPASRVSDLKHAVSFTSELIRCKRNVNGYITLLKEALEKTCHTPNIIYI